MAQKKASKKVEIETKEITVDLTQLVLLNDKYVGDIAKFLQEKIVDLKTTRDGNSLILTVLKNFSRRKIKDYLKKFLYLAKLKRDYRPITLMHEEKGYEIHKRRKLEE